MITIMMMIAKSDQKFNALTSQEKTIMSPNRELRRSWPGRMD